MANLFPQILFKFGKQVTQMYAYSSPPPLPTTLCSNIFHAALEKIDMDGFTGCNQTDEKKKKNPPQSWAACLGPRGGINQKCLHIQDF